MKLLGWTSAYTSGYQTEKFTKEHERLLVECIQRRHYNFNHADHMFLDYAAPYYDTGKICVLTKAEWDNVMSKAYSEMSRGKRLMPEDAIKRQHIRYVLYENKNDEPKGGESHG
jgi:hypothetical protein